MAFKMKGAPMHDLSSKHGTNANYKKSGAPNMNQLGQPVPTVPPTTIPPPTTVAPVATIAPPPPPLDPNAGVLKTGAPKAVENERELYAAANRKKRSKTTKGRIINKIEEGILSGVDYIKNKFKK